jgi:hypothetical protein
VRSGAQPSPAPGTTLGSHDFERIGLLDHTSQAKASHVAPTFSDPESHRLWVSAPTSAAPRNRPRCCHPFARGSTWVVSCAEAPQHSFPRPEWCCSRGKREFTFLRVSEARKSQPPAPPAVTQCEPPTLRGRPRCYPTASAALSRPRAALAAFSDPFPGAQKPKTGFSRSNLVQRGSPRGPRHRSCAIPTRGAASPRSQLLARACPAPAPPPRTLFRSVA